MTDVLEWLLDGPPWVRYQALVAHFFVMQRLESKVPGLVL
jgi:hypothetical protein